MLAAAGNCVGVVVYPARYEEVIAVAGINKADQPWKGTCRGEAVDISAPGEFVLRAYCGIVDAEKLLLAPLRGAKARRSPRRQLLTRYALFAHCSRKPPPARPRWRVMPMRRPSSVALRNVQGDLAQMGRRCARRQPRLRPCERHAGRRRDEVNRKQPSRTSLMPSLCPASMLRQIWMRSTLWLGSAPQQERLVNAIELNRVLELGPVTASVHDDVSCTGYALSDPATLLRGRSRIVRCP